MSITSSRVDRPGGRRVQQCFFPGIYRRTPRKSDSWEISEISISFFIDLEERKNKKFRAKNENFIAGRPKMALLVKLFLNPGVSGDTWELLWCIFSTCKWRFSTVNSPEYKNFRLRRAIELNRPSHPPITMYFVIKRPFYNENAPEGTFWCKKRCRFALQKVTVERSKSAPGGNSWRKKKHWSRCV